MVSLAAADVGEHLRTIRRSADYAIIKLAENASDPLALGCYLWVVRRRNLTLVNGDTLASWGESWVREVLLQKHTGRRADEDIAAAALAAVALYDDQNSPGIKDELRSRLNSILESELGKAVPLGQPSYAAILLFAALTFGIENRRIDAALEKVRRAFLGWMPDGRLFGLAILACALARARQAGAVSELLKSGLSSLQSPQTGFENEVYVVEMLCALETSPGDASPPYATIAEVVMKSPAWSHLLVGQEDMPEIGDRRSVVQVSHLFRAALLDVVAYVDQARQSHVEIRLDERYRAQRLVTVPAFLFFVVLTGLIWWVFFEVMQGHAESARQYWILQHYNSQSATEALGFAGGLVLASYVFPVSMITLRVLASVLLQSSSVSQARILDRLVPAIWAYFKFWIPGVLLALVLGVVVTIIVPGIAHLLG